MQNGKTLQRLVTIPEGLPSIYVEQKLAEAPALTGSVAVPAEGSVLPDSYSYQRGDTRASVLAEMQAAMARYLATARKQRQPGIAVATPREALILASTVEKEKSEEGRVGKKG